MAGLEWTLERRFLAALVGLLPVLSVAFAVFALSRICRQYVEGKLFPDIVLSACRRLRLCTFRSRTVSMALLQGGSVLDSKRFCWIV